MLTETAPAAISRDLIEAISTGRLRPGDRLESETQLAKAYGVAPMTLRRSLAALRELGLVTTRRGRFGGTYVVDDVADRLGRLRSGLTVTAEQLHDLIDWRRAVAAEACALAAVRGTDEEFALLWRTSAEFDLVCSDVGPRRLLDARLHIGVAAAARSPHLLREEIEIQEAMSDAILSLPDFPSIARTLPHSHDALLKAVTRRDAGAARSAMVEHVDASLDWLLSVLSSLPDSGQQDLPERRKSVSH